MAIRKNTNPREMDLPTASLGVTRQLEQVPLRSLARDLSPELRDILMRNGLQAHVITNGAGRLQLAVQGHDSPLLTYNLTEKQMLALTDWGTNTANKKAYNVLTSIIGKDFDMPRNFVYARNANGRVAMGLHGYRIGVGEYGRSPYMPIGRGHYYCDNFLGWTPRRQEGFHLRRVGGQVFYQGAPMVAERPDDRLKPGEMRSGAYGFYYKGGQPQQVAQNDVLQNLQAVITPVVSKPRVEEPAKPYKELITSPVYFSNEKWQECLSSHGIIVDAQAKTLTIQSSKTNVDMQYDLKDEELAVLTSNSIKEQSLESRLKTLNGVIGGDFSESVTMDMLNSNQRIGIALKPEVEQELNQKEEQILHEEQHLQVTPETQGLDLKGEGAIIDGRDLGVINENKGWYREGQHGREVEVEGIKVEPSEEKGKYKMTAIIDGQTISHEISQKQYDKFLAVDDYHRMKLFSKVFNEVDMKTRPEANAGLGTKILAALTAGAVVTGEVMHGLHHASHHHPEVYGEHFGGPHDHVRVYHKPGVDSPNEIAARIYEAESQAVVNQIRNGR